MNNIPLAANPSVLGTGPRVPIKVADDFERRLLQRALNRDPSMSLTKALELVYAGAAVAMSGPAGPDIICFEGGPDALRLKGILPETVAMVLGRWYGLENYWGDPLVPMAVKHVWLRTMMHGNTEYDYVIGNGTPGGRGGSYKATIVGDIESLSVYTEVVETTPMRVLMDEDTAREFLEFRRKVATGEEIR
jgi:hypothetical protein